MDMQYIRPDLGVINSDTQNAIFRKRRRWRPSSFHITERDVAQRYGVPLSSLAEWRKSVDFPEPISEFGGYEPPDSPWWHKSLLAAWERVHARPAPIRMVVAAIEHDRAVRVVGSQARSTVDNSAVERKTSHHLGRK
jgi:hypothetical protein